MRVVGIDLAGSPKNDTGYCIIEDSGGSKAVLAWILHSDEEILRALKDAGADLVAVDSPLTYEGVRRKCDEDLKEYGALPVTLRGMTTLAIRGRGLAAKLRDGGFRHVEVFSTASAKILGVYHKEDFPMQKSMMALDLQGDVNTRLLTRDEIDAVVAALTGYLHLHGRTRSVGDGKSDIVVPNV
jgi:predicted nuclease with RNAse H fold